MKHYFYFFLLIAILFSACDTTPKAKPKTFWIDNPTSSAITVVFDETSYDIPAQSGLNVELNFGKHTLKYDGQSVNFVVKPNDQNCVINPTLSNYIFYHQHYVIKGKEEKGNEEIDKREEAYLYDLIMDNDTLRVPFKVIQDKLFIERYEYYWHLGITESYDNVSTIDTKGYDMNSGILSKLFRESDFIDYMGKDAFPKSFGNSGMKLNDIPAYEYITPEILNACPSKKEALEKVKVKFDSLQIITDPARFQKLTFYELYNDLNDIGIEIRRNVSSYKNTADSLCTVPFIQMQERKPSFGEMNAYVIK